MPKYEIEDTLTGKRYELEGNSPPTERELEDIFASQRGATPGFVPDKDFQTPGKIEPSVYEKYIRPITKPLVEFGGLAVGGTIGAGAGLLGAPVGAGLGYAGAKELYRQGERVLGYTPIETPSLPQRLIRTGKETVEGVTAEMGGQIGGKLIGAGLQKISSPFLEKINPKIMRASKEMESITGVGLSPAQKTESGFVDYLENIAEKSFAGGPKFTTFRGKQQEAVKKYADSMVDGLWKGYGEKLSPEQAGQIFKAVVDKKIDVFENTATALYKNVDKVSEGFNVPLGSLKQFGQELVQVSRSRGGIGSSKMGDVLIRKIGKLPDLVTFQEAQAIRSALGKEIKTMEYSKDFGSGIAKHSYGLV